MKKESPDNDDLMKVMKNNSLPIGFINVLEKQEKINSLMKAFEYSKAIEGMKRFEDIQRLSSLNRLQNIFANKFNTEQKAASLSKAFSTELTLKDSFPAIEKETESLVLSKPKEPIKEIIHHHHKTTIVEKVVVEKEKSRAYKFFMNPYTITIFGGLILLFIVKLIFIKFNINLNN